MDQGHPPSKETIVVNIGDFMMRLCNDMYKSTVHRVYNKSSSERVSMPFFFGSSSDAKCVMPWAKLNLRAKFQLRRGRCAVLRIRNKSRKV